MRVPPEVQNAVPLLYCGPSVRLGSVAGFFTSSSADLVDGLGDGYVAPFASDLVVFALACFVAGSVARPVARFVADGFATCSAGFVAT